MEIEHPLQSQEEPEKHLENPEKDEEEFSSDTDKVSENEIRLVELENISLPTKENPVFKGDLSTKEAEGHFSVYFKEEDKTAYFADIQIGYDENAPRGRGYGANAYMQIGKELLNLGYTLESTQWDKHQSAISPQALGTWKKLEKLGYAKVVGFTENKVYNRETGEEEIKETPIYQFINKQKI